MANSFDLSFHPASWWDRFVGFFDNSVLEIRFEPAYTNELGESIGGDNLFGNIVLHGGAWNDTSTAAHEFGHFLGLGHSDGPAFMDQLMYPSALSGVRAPLTLLPQERTSLINGYKGGT